MSAWLDGWASACDEFRRQLEDDPCCPHDAIDRVRFAGIAAAAEMAPTEYPTANDVLTAAAETILRTAMRRDPHLLGECRALTRGAPAIAADVLAQFALILASHYDEAAPAEVLAPSSEWGRPATP